jgi:hypothetical protein
MAERSWLLLPTVSGLAAKTQKVCNVVMALFYSAETRFRAGRKNHGEKIPGSFCKLNNKRMQFHSKEKISGGSTSGSD